MEPTLLTYLIALPVCLVAGILNGSCGGGGLIVLPTMMLLGIPAHIAIGTNKAQAVMGLIAANVRYFKNGLLSLKLALPTIICGVLASSIGASCSLLASEQVLVWLMVIALPVAAYAVFKKDGFDDSRSDDIEFSTALYVKVTIITLVIGFYDGFYGPGSGTFFIVALYTIAHLSVRRSAAHAKVINLATNLTASTIFLINGQVLIPLALGCGICSIIGAWIGSGLVIKNGSRIMKPLIAIALVLVIAKIALGF